MKANKVNKPATPSNSSALISYMSVREICFSMEAGRKYVDEREMRVAEAERGERERGLWPEGGEMVEKLTIHANCLLSNKQRLAACHRNIS